MWSSIVTIWTLMPLEMLKVESVDILKKVKVRFVMKVWSLSCTLLFLLLSAHTRMLKPQISAILFCAALQKFNRLQLQCDHDYSRRNHIQFDRKSKNTIECYFASLPNQYWRSWDIYFVWMLDVRCKIDVLCLFDLAWYPASQQHRIIFLRNQMAI